MNDPAGSTGPTRREREFARRHREILDVAVDLFAEHGYHQTTMNMIAEKAEFSVGYLYKHFAGKEDMYRELVEFHVGAIDEALERSDDPSLPPLERLRRRLDAAATHMNRYPTFMRVYNQEVGINSEAVMAAKRRYIEQSREQFAEAQAAGQLKPFDPAILAAAYDGAISQVMGVMAEKEGEDPFAGLAETVFTLLIDPLRVNP